MRCLICPLYSNQSFYRPMIIFQPDFILHFVLSCRVYNHFFLAAEAVKIKEPTNYYKILLPAFIEFKFICEISKFVHQHHDDKSSTLLYKTTFTIFLN